MKTTGLLGSLGLSLALSSTGFAQDMAESIYYGGPILTMDDQTPRAEAIAVRDGHILNLGTLQALESVNGPDTRMIDLQGHALLPGFIDPHAHVSMVGLQAVTANLLSPPDGAVVDIPSLQQALRDYAAKNPERVAQIGAIMGFGYDDSQLAEGHHPTRADLDAVSTALPVYIMHQSGHLGVGNSKALELAGIGPGSPDYEGGVIRRDEAGVPDGVLEETPHFVALGAVLAKLGPSGMGDLFLAGTEMVASYGYTTAHEGRSNPEQVLQMQAIADQGALKIDVIAHADVMIDRDFIAKHARPDYVNHFRLGGGKLTIDGSPQGFTALRDRPYYRPPANFRQDYKGYAAVSADDVFQAVDWAYETGTQLQVHSNGEGASDLLIAAVKAATEARGRADRRIVLIHGQFQREDQVQSFVDLGVFPSLFPMHTYYWGDWHRERTVGPVLADNISPTQWYLRRGAKFTSHHDAPVAFPDAMRVLDATVTRRSRSGDIIGPDQRVDVLTGLKAMTIWAAVQHFEDQNKGSLVPGKLADFVILSQDPTVVDPEVLDSLTVEATIKEGKVVYQAKPE